MARVHLTSSLAKFAQGQRSVVLEGSTVEEVLHGLGDQFPDLRTTAFDEDGRLRPHVTLFLNSMHISSTRDSNAQVGDADEIAIVAAIAGG